MNFRFNCRILHKRIILENVIKLTLENNSSTQDQLWKNVIKLAVNEWLNKSVYALMFSLPGCPQGPYQCVAMDYFHWFHGIPIFCIHVRGLSCASLWVVKLKVDWKPSWSVKERENCNCENRLDNVSCIYVFCVSCTYTVWNENELQ